MKVKEIAFEIMGLLFLAIAWVVLAFFSIAIPASAAAIFIWIVYEVLKFLGVFG